MKLGGRIYVSEEFSVVDLGGESFCNSCFVSVMLLVSGQYSISKITLRSSKLLEGGAAVCSNQLQNDAMSC